MTVLVVPFQANYYRVGFKFIALTADTLPTTGNHTGDRAHITDGDDKYWDGSAWQTDTGAGANVDVASVIPGVGATNLGKAEDAAHTSGDVGVMALAVQKATPADISSEGDYTPLQMSAGRQWVSAAVETRGFNVATTITRPANATPYTAGDIVGGAIDLGVLGPSGLTIKINDVQLEYDVAALPAGMVGLTLYLYSVTPPSATADNGVFDIPAGDRASYLGAIPIPTLADVGATLVSEIVDYKKQVKLAGTHLFGYLVTTAGFTPAGNSEVLVLTLHTEAI